VFQIQIETELERALKKTGTKKTKKRILLTGLVLLGLVLLAGSVFWGISYAASAKVNHHKGVTVSEQTGLAELSAADGIVTLEDGFAAVLYDGDYGFDAFLAQGGASSDSALLSFFSSYFGLNRSGLRFDEGGFGCSTISVQNTSGGYLFGRNFDWMPCNAMIVEAHPENGYHSISTVNTDFIHMATHLQSLALPDNALVIAALYVPLDGMNEKGLCVSVNMIEDSDTIEQNTEKPDITTTTAVRLLLDKAATVEEALQLLSEYDLHASFDYMIHFAISDASGKSVVVEYIGNVMTVTETPVVTNFYLAQGSKYGIGSQQSHTRFDILSAALAENPQMTPEMARDSLDQVSKHNFQGNETTEWSVIFDQSNLIASYYHREDYSRSYSFSVNPSD
jgi:hypothetical protein